MITKEKTKILLVDKHPDKQLELEEVLDQPDYDLVKTHSSLDAFRKLLDQHFALIVLRLPKKDHTIDLIKRLTKFNDIPILFL